VILKMLLSVCRNIDQLDSFIHSVQRSFRAHLIYIIEDKKECLDFYRVNYRDFGDMLRDDGAILAGNKIDSLDR